MIAAVTTSSTQVIHIIWCIHGMTAMASAPITPLTMAFRFSVSNSSAVSRSRASCSSKALRSSRGSSAPYPASSITATSASGVTVAGS